MLPLIRRIVVNIRARHRLIQRKQDELLDAPSEGGEGSRRSQLLRVARRLRQELKDYIAELEALGCFLRDAEAGVVECYGDLGGEIVYFTWQAGHESFLYWHPLDQSYVNRQPLPGVTIEKATEAAE